MKKKSAKASASKPSSKLHTANQFNVNRLNSVTSFSKVLAAILFVALPFFAFMLGLMYQGSMRLP